LGLIREFGSGGIDINTVPFFLRCLGFQIHHGDARVYSDLCSGASRFPSKGNEPARVQMRFVAHVAQISGGNAQANAVNSTDLVWSRLVRDQEVDGFKSFCPGILQSFALSKIGSKGFRF